jgi:hypothetical protein
VELFQILSEMKPDFGAAAAVVLLATGQFEENYGKNGKVYNN